MRTTSPTSGGVVRIVATCALQEQRDYCVTRFGIPRPVTMANQEVHMERFMDQRGAIGWGLLWLIGIPIPVLLVFFLLRGCT
jgi:hypothetical protein